MSVARVYQNGDIRLSICFERERKFLKVEINHLQSQRLLNLFGYCWLGSGLSGIRRVQVEPAHFSINEWPVSYLKRFKWKILPPNKSACKIEVRGQTVNLSFEDQNWSKSQEIDVQVYHNRNCKISQKALLCLKVLDLKRFLNSKILSLYNSHTADTSFKNWKLLYEGDVLADGLTLKECGLGNSQVPVRIELITVEAPEGGGHHQKATGGSYESIKNFKQCVNSLKKISKIVCAIRIGEAHLGSGFLIAKDWIMTNAHVIQEVKQGQKAVFFDEEGKEKKIEIPLNQVEYASEAPNSIVGLNHAGALDFSIVSLNTENLDPNSSKRISDLISIADYFFRTSQYKPPKRANIIQHPLGTDNPEGKKTIAFRDNRVKHVDRFNLHYESETAPGSSGSPVVSDEGKLIGLHSSSCKVITQIFFENLKPFFEEIRTPYEIDNIDHFYISKKSAIEVQIHCVEPHRGKWVFKERDNLKTSTDYQFDELLSSVTKKTGRDLHAWICDFLRKYDLESNIDHRYCNTAIRIERIFENLALERDRKIKALNKFIRDFSEKTEFLAPQLFWLKEDTISKVRNAAEYLKRFNYELKGIQVGGDCFYEAFWESYKNLSISKESSINKEHFISDLKCKVSSKSQARVLKDEGTFWDIEVYEMKQGNELLAVLTEVAKSLELPMIIIINAANSKKNIDYFKIYPDRRIVTCSEINNDFIDSRECVIIVDLGGHYMYALKREEAVIIMGEDQSEEISSEEDREIPSQASPKTNWGRWMLGRAAVLGVLTIAYRYSNKRRISRLLSGAFVLGVLALAYNYSNRKRISRL